MMRVSTVLRIVMTSTALVQGLVPAAHAQRRVTANGGSPQMNYSRELLKREDVRNELGLDATQRATLASLLTTTPFGQVVVHITPEYRDVSRLSAEERKQWESDVARRAAQQSLQQIEQQKREVLDVLTPIQLQRLSELDLQWRGILALIDRDLSNRLQVTPEHYRRISDIVSEFEVKRITLWGQRGGDDSAFYLKREALVRETEEKVLEFLPFEVQARWAQLIGKPFTFAN